MTFFPYYHRILLEQLKFAYELNLHHQHQAAVFQSQDLQLKKDLSTNILKDDIFPYRTLSY